ncbi:MAG: hypothetical protein HYV90_05800 [Candidatus Woesebacteria bacterium]|nr:MAG: hypothetical protein HYV90_05800 [Candidatus Woesebacteria bacterium]
MPETDGSEIKIYASLSENKIPGREGRLLPAGERVKFSPDDYKNKINVHAGFPPFLERNMKALVEITDKEGQRLPEAAHLDLVVTPLETGNENAFVVKNPHPQKEMTLWIYGKEKKLRPGEEVAVPAQKPEEYKNLPGVEDGAFYAMAGDNQAIKFSRKPLSNEVQLKNFTFSKRESGHEDYLKPNIEDHKQDDDNQELQFDLRLGQRVGGGVWETADFGTAESCEVKLDGEGILPRHVQIKIDSSIPNRNEAEITLSVAEGAKVWYKSESEKAGRYVQGKVILQPNSFFRIGEHLFYYVGRKKEGGLKIIEVKKMG